MDTTTVVTLTGATRLGCSVNGNPTWILHTSEGDYRTMSDSSAGFEVANLLSEPPLGENRTPLTLTLTRAGRVRYFSCA